MISDKGLFDYLIQNYRLRVYFDPQITNVLEMTKNFEKIIPWKHIIKINTKTVYELTIIAKDKGLNGYYLLYY